MLAGFIAPAAKAVKGVRAALGAEADALGSAGCTDLATHTSSICQDVALIQQSLGHLEGHSWDWLGRRRGQSDRSRKAEMPR